MTQSGSRTGNDQLRPEPAQSPGPKFLPLAAWGRVAFSNKKDLYRVTPRPGVPGTVLVVACDPNTIISLNCPTCKIKKRAGRMEGKFALRTGPPALAQGRHPAAAQRSGILWVTGKLLMFLHHSFLCPHPTSSCFTSYIPACFLGRAGAEGLIRN